ncbi:MAG: hypothetical protein GXP56_19525 [Deltaproteobacteria bacterium]|nr:hypothetical protein [Deltaproteobacteria bacterium]
MAKKKKHKKTGKTRKQRLKENKKFRNMSADQLISRGDACIKKLNIRDAIQAYRQARVKEAPFNAVMPKLFHAYCLRSRQLKVNKMPGEADAV